MSRIVQIWKDTTDELINKVTWPTWEELRSSTWIVIITSILFAVAIWLVDTGFDFIVGIIYDLLK